MTRILQAANVFAARLGDPRRQAHVIGILDTWFPHVERRGPWIIAHKAVSGGDPAVNSIVFSEGKHRLRSGATERLEDRIRTGTTNPDLDLGDIGFLRSAEDGSAIVRRSATAWVPWYAAEDGPDLFLSTLYEPIAALSGMRQPDELTLAAFMTGWVWFPDGRTFLKGIRLLPSGTTTYFRPAGQAKTATTVVWFDPRDCEPGRNTKAAAGARATELRELLLENLTEALDPAGGNLLTLSGGMDSSSLAYLAGAVLKLPLMTATLVPGTESFAATELSRVHKLHELIGFQHSWEFNLDTEALAKTAAGHRPSPFLILHPALVHLPTMAGERDIGVLVGGEFADDLFGGYPALWDWALNTPALTVPFATWRTPRGWRGAGRWMKVRLGKEPPFGKEASTMLAQENRSEFQEFARQTWTTLRSDGRPRPAVAALQAAQSGVFPMNWEAASRLGILRSFPYCSAAALALAYRCSPQEVMMPRFKAIMVRALEGVVPADFLRDKAINQRIPGRSSAALPIRIGVPLSDVLAAGTAREPGAMGDSSEIYRLTHLASLSSWLETVGS